jgi:hypothetical protein
MAVTRLSGGLTPANGSDPRTFPAIWNATATDIEAAETDIAAIKANNWVTTARINNLAVTEAKLAADSVTTAKILDANVTTAKIADANVTPDKLTPGSVLQVQTAILDIVATTTSTSYVDVPSLTLTLTPKKNNSKFLIAAFVTGSTSNSGDVCSVQAVRDNGTVTVIGASSGDQFAQLPGLSDANLLFSGGLSFLDSPATPLPATINYRLRFKTTAGSGVLNRNRQNTTVRSVCTLAVYEIGA